MSSATTVVTYYHSANAAAVSAPSAQTIPLHAAVSAHPAKTVSLHPTASNPASSVSVRVTAVPFWAVSGNMSRDAADVADRIVLAVTSYVT